METSITPPQVPSVHTLRLNTPRHSTYWFFVAGFLTILSLSVLGLYAISSYERRQQSQIETILNTTHATRFSRSFFSEQK